MFIVHCSHGATLIFDDVFYDDDAGCHLLQLLLPGLSFPSRCLGASINNNLLFHDGADHDRDGGYLMIYSSVQASSYLPWWSWWLPYYLKYDWENLLPDGFGLTIFRLDIVQPLSLGTNMQLPPTNYNAYGFLISRDRDWETVKMHLGMCGFIFSKIIYMSRMLHVLFDEKFRLFL